jgi:hypothetical protein
MTTKRDARTCLAFCYGREELNRLVICNGEKFITTKITSFIFLMITVNRQRRMNYANVADILVLHVQRDVHKTAFAASLLGTLKIQYLSLS